MRQKSSSWRWPGAWPPQPTDQCFCNGRGTNAVATPPLSHALMLCTAPPHPPPPTPNPPPQPGRARARPTRACAAARCACRPRAPSPTRSSPASAPRRSPCCARCRACAPRSWRCLSATSSARSPCRRRRRRLPLCPRRRSAACSTATPTPCPPPTAPTSPTSPTCPRSATPQRPPAPPGRGCWSAAAASARCRRCPTRRAGRSPCHSPRCTPRLARAGRSALARLCIAPRWQGPRVHFRARGPPPPPSPTLPPAQVMLLAYPNGLRLVVSSSNGIIHASGMGQVGPQPAAAAGRAVTHSAFACRGVRSCASGSLPIP
jgi:hypothetical protein